ncbi:MAG: heavy-metal-associated domain-containing protein [Deltaproteobacteria bacterium]|nr:heavy-metal-associated domain-containing protein [Deltaproteobacteria bacterium]
METKTVKIPDMSCGHCLMNIKREAMDVPGVKKVEGDPNTKVVTFEWEAPAEWDKIAAVLKDAGYPPQ